MKPDFYLDERGLAAYFEKDWIDHVEPNRFEESCMFAGFPASYLYSDYHERSVKLLHSEAKEINFRPKSLLEIGASLGRTYFEACKAFPSLETAKLVEPSQNLTEGFRRIFAGGDTEKFQVLKGFSTFSELSLNTAPIKATCKHVKAKNVFSSFQDLELKQNYDLVICSNVIDQCKNPRALAEVLKEATKPGGLLLLSCTYQWQNKYTGNAVKLINDIKELFGPGWTFKKEANIPFHLRRNERHWLEFLSHVVIYLKNEA